MALLNKELISAQPTKQTITAGKAVLSNNGSAFTFWGSVQPVGSKVVQMLEEGARKSAKWIIYTEGSVKPFEVLPAKPGVSPRLTTSKGTLIPTAELDMSDDSPGAILPNTAYICSAAAADEPTP